MSGFHISLPPWVASLHPSMIAVSGADSQGANIPIRGCTCTVSRTRSPAIAALLLDRQREDEAAAATQGALDPDPAAVQLDEACRVEHRLALPSNGCCESGGLAVAAGSVWVPGIARGVLWRIDSRGSAITATIPLRRNPADVRSASPQASRWALGPCGLGNRDSLHDRVRLRVDLPVSRTGSRSDWATSGSRSHRAETAGMVTADQSPGTVLRRIAGVNRGFESRRSRSWTS
jgi:hypothetical protein